MTDTHISTSGAAMKARFRVTGAMLPTLIGREVSILGKAVHVATSGRSVTIRCADGPEVECNLLSALQTSPENCVLEVQGRVVDGRRLEATADVIVFSAAMSANFVEAAYAQAIQLTAQFDRFYVQPMSV